MPAITIEAHDQAVQQALAALARRIGNVGAALGLVGEEMLERIDRRFDTENGPDGARWAPLRAATKRRKRGSKILTESGDLRCSITRQVAGAALTLGAHEPHAAIHRLSDSGACKSVDCLVHLVRAAVRRTRARGLLLGAMRSPQPGHGGAARQRLEILLRLGDSR